MKTDREMANDILCKVNSIKEERRMMMSKPFKTVAMMVAIIMVLTCSAFAVATLMNPSDVVNRFGEKELATLFEESDFKPITVKGEEYTVTFMGTAQGKEINADEQDGPTVIENRTYGVFAIYRNDGTALSQLDDSPLMIVPVADGHEVNELFSYGMSSTRFSKDGVLYYMYDYTDLQGFSDTHISLMAIEGSITPVGILTANEKGEIVYKNDYAGFKAVFELDSD